MVDEQLTSGVCLLYTVIWGQQRRDGITGDRGELSVTAASYLGTRGVGEG